MNYGKIKTYDIADGPGVRVSLFVSGCTHHCPGCFNKETWDFDYGEVFGNTEQFKILEELQHEYIQGLSILGGEPFEPQNRGAVLDLVKRVRVAYPDKDIWCYSGYTLEHLLRDEESREILNHIDVLVDGPFVEAKRSLMLRFRGSSNQRIIDVPATLSAGEVVYFYREGEERFEFYDRKFI